MIDERVQTVSATVVAVDQATRQVTLKNEDGRQVVLRVGDEVRNLPQVKAGDKVRVSFYEATSGRLLRPGEALQVDGQEEIAAGRAPEGERPAAAIGRRVTTTATIASIDHDYPSVTLKDANGVETLVRVRDKARLKEVQVGDQVAITYTEGVAISVDPAE